MTVEASSSAASPHATLQTEATSIGELLREHGSLARGHLVSFCLDDPWSSLPAAWREALGDGALINKRSKTWRDFDDASRQAAEADPLPVLAEHPTLIKRPILETSTTTLAGFSPARYETVLAGAD